MEKYTQETFIKKCNEKHNNRYDYSKVLYKNSKTNVTIGCEIHGDFEQLAGEHMHGAGCRYCHFDHLSIIKSKGRDAFIIKAKEIHHERYDYSKVVYINGKTDVIIGCEIHGDFGQRPEVHLRGAGCDKCARASNSGKKTDTREDFIRKAKEVHGDEYGYNNVNYVNARINVDITCKIHGDFPQTPDNHLRKNYRCPSCGCTGISKPEIEVGEFIKSLGIDIISGAKNIIPNKDLDIYVPSHKMAIEFDGLYWHCEVLKAKDYHIKKTLACEAIDIQLIHIFEDEWKHKKDIVKSRLKNILGLTENKIFARKTEIRELSTLESKEFLELNHIQGNVNSSVKLGLYYKDELISIMVFGSLRKSMGQQSKEGYYELLRFCNKLNVSIIGGASKLLKYFSNLDAPPTTLTFNLLQNLRSS